MAKLNNLHKYPEANHQPKQDAQFRMSEVKERQAYYDGLTIAQKIEKLDTKLGKGLGAKKQRAKLSNVKTNPATGQVALSGEQIEQIISIENEKPKIKAKERRKQEQK